MSNYFELSDRQWNFDGTTYYRLRAITDIPSVGIARGGEGGWVESLDNIQDNAILTGTSRIRGNAVIRDNARVFDNVTIYDNAIVQDNAVVSNDAKVFGRAVVKDDAFVSGYAVIRDNGIVNEDMKLSGRTVIRGQEVERVPGEIRYQEFPRELKETILDANDMKTALALAAFFIEYPVGSSLLDDNAGYDSPYHMEDIAQIIRAISERFSDQGPMEKEQDNLHYEFTGETKVVDGVTVYRIRAVRDIPSNSIKSGAIGGWVSSTKNLQGHGWIADEAVVMNNAVVSEGATVGYHAIVKDTAQVRGYANIVENSLIKGNAVVDERALVMGNTVVAGYAHISDDAVVAGKAIVEGNATVCGYAAIRGDNRLGGYDVLDGEKTMH